MALLNLAGARPAGLGVGDSGQLRPCPEDASHCVVSQYPGSGREPARSHIHPFRYSGPSGEAMTRLLAVLLQQPRCTLVTTTPTYVHAEFRSARLGFVDDVEFQLGQAESVIHVRAASRIGIGDLGTNRARLEELREAFDAFDE